LITIETPTTIYQKAECITRRAG